MVSRTGFHNGVSDFVDEIDGIEPYPEGAITLALGGSVGSTFVQTAPFYTGQNVGVIEFENKSFLAKQFVAAVLAKTCSLQFSAFRNEINKHFKRDLTIPLPLKHGTNPTDYSQDDIDWDYMEGFMSSVLEVAKERLDNLPEPGQKSKTPVDTTGWGEFKVGELFDVHPTKAYKLKNSDLLSVDGEVPVVVNSSYNNGIGGYSNLESTEHPGILTFSDTTSGSNTLFYQNQPFIGYAHVQGMYPKNFELTDLTALFIIATLRATIDQCKWDYTNKLNRTAVIKMRVKLPLKSGTDLENYSQSDIDWDFMEKFMGQFQELAKNRLEQLNLRCL